MTAITPIPPSVLRHGLLLGLIASCAAPSTGGTGAVGVATGPALALERVTVDDHLAPCDGGACGTLTVTLRNTGTVALGATTAAISSPSPAVSYPLGSTLAFTTMAPGASATASLRFAYRTTAAGSQPLDVRIYFTDPQLTGGPLTALVASHVRADPVARTATTHTVAPAAPAPPDGIPTSADLAITVNDGTATASPGGSVTYTIIATNLGPDGAVGAIVSDPFPSDLTCSWTCAHTPAAACTASGIGNISDTVTLPLGAATVYTASCTISSTPTSGTLSNTVTVTPPGGVTDPVPGNNSATDADSLGRLPAHLTGEKTVTGSFVQSGTVTYTIVLHSDGAGATFDNAGNELVDTLPAELTLVSATASTGIAVATLNSNTVTWNGAIAAGTSETITITATINAAAGVTVSNQASLFYDADGNGTNESTGATDAYVCAAG